MKAGTGEQFDPIRGGDVRLQERAISDEGFSLLEVVISMVILGIALSSVASILTGALGTTKNNAQRVTAANLAAQQIEMARSQRATDIPDGVTTPVPGVTIDGTTFTVTQTSAYLSSGATTSLCSGSTNDLAYKRITETVTWPGMGSTKPVRADTVVSVGLDSDARATGVGTVALRVQSATGTPQAGVAVTLNPLATTQITGDDGCAVFARLPGGAYTATASRSGYVSVDGQQTAVAGNLGVTPGKITRSAINYDRAGALAVSLTAPSGYTPTSAVPVTLDFSLFTPDTARVFPDCAVTVGSTQCVSGSPRTASALFPGKYAAWAGACLDAKPPMSARVDVTPGATTPYSAALGGVDITVNAVVGTSVYAIKNADSRCTTTTSLNLGQGSKLKVALPPGSWTFSLTADASMPPAGGWPTATVVAGSISAVTVTT
jgi:prepilin-type N-terminal cleavage/methylation domain-containing protein